MIAQRGGKQPPAAPRITGLGSSALIVCATGSRADRRRAVDTELMLMFYFVKGSIAITP